MSMSGQRRLELERDRLEQVRLGQVRDECVAIVESCERTLRGVTDIAVQQHLGAGLQQVAETIRNGRVSLGTQPDTTLAALTEAQAELFGELTRAEASARAWTVAQVDVIGRARAAAAAKSNLQGTSSSAEAEDTVRKAERGDLVGAEADVDRLARETATARTNVLDERVRREVVRGLVSTLKGMGFLAVSPRLAEGVVVLEGRLVSGRKARFEIDLAGGMSFDLDGYEGRACADELKKVEVTLRDEFGVRLGPPQVIWKNPDRLSQEARQLPTSGSRRGP